MAGLLGEGWSDPQSAANMALAAGLLRKDFGGGLLGAQQAYGQARKGLLDQRITDAQLRNYDSEIEARKLKGIQDQRQQALIQSMFPGMMGGSPSSPSAPSAPSAPGMGAPGATAPEGQGMAAAPAGQGGGNDILSLSQRLGIPPEAIKTDMVFNGGKGISEMLYKRGAPDMQVTNGYAYDKNRVGAGYLPQLNTSQDGKTSMVQIGPDGLPVVSAPQGALQTFSGYQNAQEGAKAGYDPVKVYNPQTGREEYSTRSQVVQSSQPAAPMRAPTASEAGMRSQAQGNMGADPAAIERELQRISQSMPFVKDPASRQMLQEQAADLQRQKAALPGRMAAGPSVNEKNSAEAGGQINQSWIKTSYEPVLSAGNNARDLVDTVQVTRQAMQNLGKTGWGTQAQAAGAAVLNGLGIAPQNAKLFAANAEVFQSKAMDRLQITLNAATGPQTEGDAQRASKTFSSLGNTTQANEFILDMAEAKAQRDQMKARFYQEAQPIARQKGDLSEVDREWAKRSPSIFTMPTMKRWGGGIK